MESGIEDGDLGSIGHDRLAGTDAHQVGRVVKGAQGDALLDGLDDLVVDNAGVGELHAAMEHTVANGIDLVNGLDDTVHRIYQDVQNRGNGLGMGGHGDVLDHLLIADLVGQAAVDVDPLAQALGGNFAAFGVHELVLQGRTTGINNQNVHWNLLRLKIRVSFSLRCDMITRILYSIFPVFSTPNRKFFSNWRKNFGIRRHYL